MSALTGKKIAILLTDGFEQVEMTSPRDALRLEGATMHLIAPKEEVRGWTHTEWGDRFPVDVPLAEADPADYDGLLLPGGVMNPDTLRQNEAAVRFVLDFFASHKPVAAICHAPILLIEAGVVEGRTLTSYPSIQTDLRNAGATWVDEEVHVENGLTTSRSPEDLAAFNAAIIREFSAVSHAYV